MTLITKLLINQLTQSRSTADAGDQSPASGLVHHTGRPSMAWKEPERRTWAQSGLNARDWASQNACLIGGGYFIHARFRPTYRSPPIWGQGVASSNLASPTSETPCQSRFEDLRNAKIHGDLLL